MDKTTQMLKTAMQSALAEAAKAAESGEVPVGAVIFHRPSNAIVAAAHNLVEQTNDASAHAELLAMRMAAAKIGQPRLTDCDLYVTLEPCTMCAAAIAHFRIGRVYFGAYDPKGGGIEHGAKFFTQPTCHHRPEIYGGIDEQASAELLRRFFQSKRN